MSDNTRRDMPAGLVGEPMNLSTRAELGNRVTCGHILCPRCGTTCCNNHVSMNGLPPRAVIVCDIVSAYPPELIAKHRAPKDSPSGFNPQYRARHSDPHYLPDSPAHMGYRARHRGTSEGWVWE